jgi:hypothetical protein
MQEKQPPMTTGRISAPLRLALLFSLVSTPLVFLSLRSMADEAADRIYEAPAASDALLLTAALGAVLLAGFVGGLYGTLVLRRARLRFLAGTVTVASAWFFGVIGTALATVWQGTAVPIVLLCFDSCGAGFSIGTLELVGAALQKLYDSTIPPAILTLPVAGVLVLAAFIVSRLRHNRAAGVVSDLLAVLAGVALFGFSALFAIPIAVILSGGVVLWLARVAPRVASRD